MLDWTRYIYYTGADERRNQPVQNGTIGRPLRQGSPSLTTAPAAAVPAQRTGFQPCKLQLLSLWSNSSLKTQSRDCWLAEKERHHPRQPQMQGRSSSDRVLLLISKQRSTEHNSQIFRESEGHHGETLSVGTGYQLCPMQPSHKYRKENLSHRLQGTANDSGQCTLPIVVQGEMMKLSYFSAASKRQSSLILRRRGTLDPLQWRSEQNFWQLKQKHVSETWQ